MAFYLVLLEGGCVLEIIRFLKSNLIGTKSQDGKTYVTPMSWVGHSTCIWYDLDGRSQDFCATYTSLRILMGESVSKRRLGRQSRVAGKLIFSYFFLQIIFKSSSNSPQNGQNKFFKFIFKTLFADRGVGLAWVDRLQSSSPLIHPDGKPSIFCSNIFSFISIIKHIKTLVKLLIVM